MRNLYFLDLSCYNNIFILYSCVDHLLQEGKKKQTRKGWGSRNKQRGQGRALMASVLYFFFFSLSSPIPGDSRNVCRSLSVNGDVDKVQTWEVFCTHENQSIPLNRYFCISENLHMINFCQNGDILRKFSEFLFLCIRASYVIVNWILK